MGVIYLPKDEQFTNFIFWISWKEKLLYECMDTENTLKGKISTKSVYISVNNKMNLTFFKILFIYTLWDLSLKTISRYCPFKGLGHQMVWANFDLYW